MSRNDMYLSLCLEQASLSPLHYRHGSIIVRGGKVIGRGFNDYRSGYNGGALTTGQLRSTSAVRGPAVRALKTKYKAAQKQIGGKSNDDYRKSPKFYNASTNKAVGSGGGCLANTPLSMHSEMMAINAALSLSSTNKCQGNARSTQWQDYSASELTPTRSASRSPQRLSPPPVACLRFNSRALNPAQAYYAAPYKAGNSNKEQHVKDHPEQQEDQDLKPKTHVNALEYQEAESLRYPTDSRNEKHRKQYLYGLQQHSPLDHHHHHTHHHHHHHQNRRQTNESSLAQRFSLAQRSSKSQPTVLPQNRISGKTHQVAERMKDSRLKGADLYVARLGRTYVPAKSKSSSTVDKKKLNDDLPKDQVVKMQDQPSTGSLHDELRCPSSADDPPSDQDASSSFQQASATHSRPCYRCISYMHSAGIKRVFWTNAKGEWEGGKVRDLVDDLDSPPPHEGSDGNASPARSPVFVTKGEVLMLKGLNK